jgi:hypothetical protein
MLNRASIPASPLKNTEETMDIRDLDDDVLSKILKNDAGLVSIKLRSATCNAVDKLCNALTNNTVARSLDLSFSAIGDIGIASVAKLMYTNKTFHVIKLRSCGITDHGCSILADSVQHCDAPLRLIDLANNLLTDSSTVVLESSIRVHASRRSFQGPSLQILLSGNQISADHCTEIAIPRPNVSHKQSNNA